MKPATGKAGMGKLAKAGGVEYQCSQTHIAAATGGYMLRTGHSDWDAEWVVRTY